MSQFFTNQNKLHRILMSADFEKAFDSLNWNFVFKTLEHANFGNIYIGYIKTLYNNVEFTVFNNRNLCKSFKIQREVRHGCSLSANLILSVILKAT